MPKISVESDMYNQGSIDRNDRRERFAQMKSLSTESRGSSVSIGSNGLPKQVAFNIAGGRSMGGSYSSKTGASSQIIRQSLGESDHTPKLAQIAKQLMAAKEAGELPQASNKDLELQESFRKAQQEKLLKQQTQNGTAPRLK